MSVNEDRKLDESEYKGITPPNPRGYDQIKFQNKPSIVMSVDDDYMKSPDFVNKLYKTATHEMVHCWKDKYYSTGKSIQWAYYI